MPSRTKSGPSHMKGAEKRQFYLCLRKRRHSKDSAQKAAAEVQKRPGGAEVRPYKCPHCGFWHIGKSSKKKKTGW